MVIIRLFNSGKGSSDKGREGPKKVVEPEIISHKEGEGSFGEKKKTPSPKKYTWKQAVALRFFFLFCAFLACLWSLVVAVFCLLAVIGYTFSFFTNIQLRQACKTTFAHLIAAVVAIFSFFFCVVSPKLGLTFLLAYVFSALKKRQRSEYVQQLHERFRNFHSHF
ncbi:hypothetical protein JYU14_04225 [Simkania negevensis]|uniref:Uncharacterized protein n=1 Tax=Simkania negevensis TaxID=83561 RepID=A0ABS3ARA2_9BACT|nr:hypothetical protein [Simkania negevensis]